MDLSEVIKTRRSIRKFKNIVPEDTVIRSVLESVIYTPSPSNMQPLELVIIKNIKKKKEMKKSLIIAFNSIKKDALRVQNKKQYRQLMAYWRYITPIFSAPIVIVAGLSNYRGISSLLPPIYRSKGNSGEIYLGASLYNITLNAHNLGLGSCIYTAPIPLLNPLKLKKQFGINVQAFLTLGYPDEIPKTISKKNIKEIIKNI